MKTDGSVKRLIIEPDYLFTNAMSYYKAADFDATLPLKIRYEGQVAIDGGGVLRQFFQDIFDAAETGSDGVPPLFEGDYGYKLPSSNALIVSSDLMETFGKILVHAIVQTGSGLRSLSKAVYQYLIHGEIESAAPLLSINDLPCGVTKQYLTQLISMDDSELPTLNTDDGFQELLQNCEISVLVTASTKLSIVQSVLIHHVLTKKKVVIDQLRKGLKTLGLLQEMSLHPTFYECFFTAESSYKPADVINKIKFADSEESDREAWFRQFILTSSDTEIKKFLVYTTGSNFLPRKNISIRFCTRNGFSNSTCAFTIDVPSFNSFEEFKTAFKAAITPGSKKFTSL